MEAAIALAVFIGLPIAVLLLVVAAKRRYARKARQGGGGGGDGWLEPRVAELEALAESEDRWRITVEQRLAALEQDRAPLYRVQ